MAADLVTLSWCLGEIREALAQTDRLLERQLASEDDDFASLRAARASLHQAHGALQVVAIEGAPLLTQEAERLLDAVERGEVPLSGRVVSKLARAFQALVEHLETLLRDVPHQPLYLFPYYRGLLEARRADRIHPADLFFPESAPMRAPDPAGGYRDADAATLAAARAGFERGLLQVMRGADVAGGTAAMGAAIDTVAASQVGAANRSFWWVAEAWFEALAGGALEIDLQLKRLLGRLNLQLRKAIEERAPVAGQLMREMLFALAGVGLETPRVSAVRAGFGLARAVPPDFEQPRYGRLDARVLRAAREAIVKARTAFDKVTRGNAGELAAFSEAIDLFCDCVQQMPAEGLRALGRALADVRARLGDHEGLPGEALSLELATAILFAEQALEDGARPESDHDRHGHEMARRLGAAFAGDGHPSAEMPEWLRSLSRAAQDRMTMIAFVAETGNNLRAVEKSLDAFFRDPSQRDDLPACVRSLHQVAGALRLLGHAGAAAGAESVAGRVAALADSPDGAADQAGFERIASSVGAIGFFVEGLQRPDRPSGRFEYDEATGDFHAHLTQSPLAASAGAPEGASAGAAQQRASTGLAGDSADAAAQASSVDGGLPMAPSGAGGPQPSVETALEDHAQEAASLFDALAERPGDRVLRSALRETIGRVRDAAMLLDRADRRHGADEALALLDSDGDVDAAALGRTLEAAGVALPVAHEPSAPMPADEAAIDSELLEIFLGEAEEVLTAIGEHAALSLAAPSEVDYLTTIRRGFHTLKGSSRMVGLTAFGEAGWALEQVMNQWLADERPGSEPLFELIDEAVARMSEWVRGLREDPSSAAAIDPAPLVAHADAVREGREPPLAAGLGARAEAPGQVEVAQAAEPARDPELATAIEVAQDFEMARSIDATEAIDAVEVSGLAEDMDFLEVQEAGGHEDTSAPGPAEAEALDADAIRVFGADFEAGAEVEVVELSAADEAQPGAEPLVEAVAGTTSPASDIVRIGQREISRALYMIFLSEADDLLSRLVDDVQAWRAHPPRGASTSAMRAVHSLAGSAAIVQLDGVHHIAERLEAFMQAQRACAQAP
ncbi:MAG TPA: Hpt domain-containing protein, partial [Quisquiliibacterium sp.]|nr:Hpt domain-containing protein [Quisquiliibacterium sp.]